MARNTSSAYKEQIKGVRQFCAKVMIEYADGMIDTLTELSDFKKIKIADACSDTNEFVIGAAVMNEAVITLNNRTGKFDGKNFHGAELTVYTGILVNDVPELLKMGRYLVDEPISPGISINIVAYDRMIWMDRTYTPGIAYPATLAQVVTDACEQCGLTVKSIDFPRADYIVENAPEKCTCREVVAAAAQLTGCFARCDADGQTELRWYSAAVDYEITSLRSKNICTDDVTITGITIFSGDEEMASAGEDGYRLTVKDNILLESGKEQETADYLAGKLIGLQFRPLSITCKSDPSIEAGDRIKVVDEKGNSYETVVTNTSFAVLETQSISCNAASPTVNSSQRLSQTAQAIIASKKYTQEYTDTKFNAHDQALKDLANRIATSSGMYVTEVPQENGSMIYYAHNKPLLEESQHIWKFTIEAIAISTDGGNTWLYGLDISGTAILNRIYTVGLNADYITTGTFTVKDDDGNIVFSANKDTGQVIIAALTAFENKMGEYLRINPEEESISLGSSKNPIILKVVNNRIAFMQAGTEIAWFSDNQLHTRQLVVTELANLCGLIITQDENGDIFIS